MGNVVNKGPNKNTVNNINTISAGYILKKRFQINCFKLTEVTRLCVIRKPLMKKKMINPILPNEIDWPVIRRKVSFLKLFVRSKEWLIKTKSAAKWRSKVILLAVRIEEMFVFILVDKWG